MRGMSASLSLGDGPPLPLLCFVEIKWLHVHRIGVRGYRYIHGYPRKNCGYGYGYGWDISYPRQAWFVFLVDWIC